MKILAVSTDGGTIRSPIFGWTFEDASLYVRGKPLGYTPSPRDVTHYGTVLEAVADGWRLLGPPVPTPVKGGERFHDWWLAKEPA